MPVAMVATMYGILTAAVTPRPGVRAFLGQRYSLPPTGDRRFAPATVAPFNESTLDPMGGQVAGSLGSECTQSSTRGAEDCLFANIYAPVDSLPRAAGGRGTAAPVAVLFWIHGGGWTAGSGNDYNGTVLASGQQIIVVAINYRLGGLGFFASEELAAMYHNATGGMNGILDMITALRWVQQVIARFGGDPGKITIAGESAGAEAVCSLLVSPVARGLFKRAIVESGPCLKGSMGWGPHPGRADPEDPDPKGGYIAVSQALARQITGKPHPTIADLRAVDDPRKFVDGGTSIKDSIDGYVMPVQPVELFRQNGTLNALDVMIGGNSYDGLATYYIKYEVLFSKGVLSASAYRDRMRSDWGSNAPDVESLYSLDRYGGNTNAAAVQPNGDAAVVCPSFDVARLVNAAGGTAYSFHFDYGPVCGDVASSMRTGPHWASHASELAWVWGYEPHCYRNGSEQRLTQVMQDYWGSFVRDGAPSATAGTGAPAWDAWVDDAEGGGAKTMVLDLQPRLVAQLKQADCRALLAINASFWPGTPPLPPSGGDDLS